MSDMITEYGRWCDTHAGELDMLGIVHTINRKSISCGPLTRTELFFQGCERACPGCFSPETWDMVGGWAIPVQSLITITSPMIGNEGFSTRISICGGEPMLQPEYLVLFLTNLRRAARELGQGELSVLLYSGFEFEEITADEKMKQVLPLIDMLVAGPYIQSLCCMYQPTDFIGSLNQTLFMLREGVILHELTATAANYAVSTPDRALLLHEISVLHR